MLKHELYTKVQGEGNSVLEVYYGYEPNLGYYLTAIPTIAKDYKGHPMVQYEGKNVKEIVVIEAKRYSEKRWVEFCEKVSNWQDYFKDIPTVQPFIKG